jgi:hypothetical protein
MPTRARWLFDKSPIINFTGCGSVRITVGMATI